MASMRTCPTCGATVRWGEIWSLAKTGISNGEARCHNCGAVLELVPWRYYLAYFLAFGGGSGVAGILRDSHGGGFHWIYFLEALAVLLVSFAICLLALVRLRVKSSLSLR